MASKQLADQELDPKYEWQENAANFLLRVHLSGFRKEDFRVQVDGAGRLTVRGQRADGGKHVRFHKVFQLPPTANLEDISGRFDAGVLNITVPKRPAPPPATIEDIRKPTTTTTTNTTTTKEEKVEAKKKPEEKHKADLETNKKPEEQHKAELETNKKPEEQQKAELETIKKPAEEKKAEATNKKPQGKKAADDQEQKTMAPPAVRKEPKVEGPTTKTKPSQQTADRDSLLERARRRAEEERAKAAAEEAERQKKQSACGGWKERVAGELQGIKAPEWAEGALDTVKKNKEVIAAAVAAFSIGLFVSSRLFSRK